MTISPALFSYEPIYNPKTFNLRAVAAGTSLAALVFIGFDGVSILAEEVKNPRRNVLLASVLVCVFTGLFSGLQVYLAQRVWPDHTTLLNPETAFMDVAQRASGPLLFTAYGVMLLVSSLACGLAGHVGAARILYGMGRDDVLPRKIFGYVHPKKGNPTYNIWIVGALAYVAVLTIPWERSAEIVTFGALLAFMGVNLVSLMHFWFSPAAAGRRNFFIDAFVPSFGFVFCFLLLISLQTWTKFAGLAWLVVGTYLCDIQNAIFYFAPKINRLQRILTVVDLLYLFNKYVLACEASPLAVRETWSGEPARFSDPQFRLQFSQHRFAAIPGDSFDKQFRCFAAQLMFWQFHGG